MPKEKKEVKYEEEKNVLEYVVFYLSLLMVVSLLGYLVYAAATLQKTDPQLEVQFEQDPQPNSPFLYRVYISNKGTSTAEDIVVEMVLEKSGEAIEKSVLKLMFISGNSRAKGWVNFHKNPADADAIYARVVSFKSS